MHEFDRGEYGVRKDEFVDGVTWCVPSLLLIVRWIRVSVTDVGRDL